MNKKQSKKSVYVLGLLMLGAFALAFQLGTGAALAQCNDPNDTDCDGFSYALENSGFNLTLGMQMAPDTGPLTNIVPKCVTGSIRQNCVDPAKQDLFVIIQRGARACVSPTLCGVPCYIPMFTTTNIAPYLQYVNIYGTTRGPLEWVSGIATGFSTHEIVQNPPSTGPASQQVGGGWYAVKIVENLNPCNTYMGISTPAVITPTAPGSATVYSEKIMNSIDTLCSQACFVTNKQTGAQTCYYVPLSGVTVPANTALKTYVAATGNFTCTNADHAGFTPINMKTAPNLTPLYHDMIKNVISHETSHLMHLAWGSGTSADHHWPVAQGTLMEQYLNVKATKTGNNIAVTLYISTAYDSRDPQNYLLRP